MLSTHHFVIFFSDQVVINRESHQVSVDSTFYLSYSIYPFYLFMFFLPSLAGNGNYAVAQHSNILTKFENVAHVCQFMSLNCLLCS